ERKRVEEELRSSSDTLQAVVYSSPLAIVTFDKDGNIGMWNPAAERMFGWRAEEVMGRPHPIVPEDKQDEFREFRESAPGGRTFTGRELRRLRKDGSYIDISVSTAPLRDAAGSITSVMSIITDITERKRAEEEKRNLERQVQRAQKMESLGVLAGGIAHDFNNLLMVVLGHAELALNEISPMSPARGSLTEITTAARRAADLCRQMLAYAGKASFALERVGLRELVEEMAHLLKTAISKKAILNLNLERGLPPIEADPSQIRQIVMNLIINASEAIGDRSGVITVSVGATRCDEEYLRKTELREDLAPGLYVHLEVTDTGGGMDAETRSRIFEPFFSTKFTGRGLGLAAVLGIVRAHKGALKVYSEPGKGTTFKILFPALTEGEDATLSSGASPLADWRGKGTILLVDDEESLIALGARMLEHLGFTVLTAADGLQAVELYRERGKEINLVLMDLTMPHMDGAKAFGELRRLNPDVRVVLASGYSHEDVASRFAGKGLDGVLQKPYTLAKLRELLAGLMPKRLDGEG
ncbi:MAG: PAS domain S-box protein, partial [bacterium]